MTMEHQNLRSSTAIRQSPLLFKQMALLDEIEFARTSFPKLQVYFEGCAFQTRSFQVEIQIILVA